MFYSFQANENTFKAEFDPYLKLRLRPHSAAGSIVGSANNNSSNSKKANVTNKITNDPLYEGLSPNEQLILKTVIDENHRSGGWVRLYPTSDSMEFYSQYLETRSTSFNTMLHKKLFPRRWQSGNAPKKSSQSRAK